MTPSPTRTTVHLLGTSGGPVPVRERAMTSHAVVVGDATYVVDCGDGVVDRLLRAGIELSSVRAIFVTHQHIDHIGGYFPLILAGAQAFVAGSHYFSDTIQVYGPGSAGANSIQPQMIGDRGLINPQNPAPSMSQIHEGLLNATAYSMNRMFRETFGPLSRDVRDIVEVHDLQGGVGDGAPEEFVVREDDRVRVTAIPVEHNMVPSFAFRFQTLDGVVVFSGDTRRCESLVRLATAADILVHEVMFSEEMIRSGSPRDLVEHLGKVHTDITEVGSVAAEANASSLVLSHLIALRLDTPTPPPFRPDHWQPVIRRDFDKPTELAHDLMAVDVRSRAML